MRDLIRQIVVYPLYSSDSFSITGRASFNNGLRALLACAAEIGAHVESQDSAMKPPYFVDVAAGSINGLSISYASGEEGWLALAEPLSWKEAIGHAHEHSVHHEQSELSGVTEASLREMMRRASEQVSPHQIEPQCHLWQCTWS